MNQDYLKSSKKSVKLGKSDYCMSGNYDEKLIKFFPEISSKQVYELSTKYPLQSYKDLKTSIQKLFSVKNLVFSAGCENLIVKICKTANFNKNKVGVVLPTFYRIIDNLHKYESIDWDNFDKTNYKKFDYIFIVNPNTLNGQVIPKDSILDIVKNHPSTVFVVDETSILFLENWEKVSLSNKADKYNNLLVISSLSKFFGLSGNRIGFATGSPKLLAKLSLGLETFPISNIGAFIANSIIPNNSFIELTRQRIFKNKKEVAELLDKSAKVGVLPSKNNCIYCYSKQKSRLHKVLNRLGVVGLDLDCQNGIERKGLVRLTIHGSETKHKFLISKLKQII